MGLKSCFPRWTNIKNKKYSRHCSAARDIGNPDGRNKSIRRVNGRERTDVGMAGRKNNVTTCACVRTHTPPKLSFIIYRTVRMFGRQFRGGKKRTTPRRVQTIERRSLLCTLAHGRCRGNCDRPVAPCVRTYRVCTDTCTMYVIVFNGHGRRGRVDCCALEHVLYDFTTRPPPTLHLTIRTYARMANLRFGADSDYAVRGPHGWSVSPS